MKNLNLRNVLAGYGVVCGLVLEVLAAAVPAVAQISPRINLDDTAFAPNPKAFLLVTDINAGVIYRIDSGTFGFEPGTAYSASDTQALVGTLNLDNGLVAPVIAGLGSPRGLLFISPDGDKDGDDK